MGASSSIIDTQVRNPDEKSLAELCAERKRECIWREQEKRNHLHHRSQVTRVSRGDIDKHKILNLHNIADLDTCPTRIRSVDSTPEKVFLPSVWRKQINLDEKTWQVETSDHNIISSSSKNDKHIQIPPSSEFNYLPRIERHTSTLVPKHANHPILHVGHVVFMHLV